MRRIILILLIGMAVFVCLILLSPVKQSAAAPIPPLRVVNHETKECGEIFGGDECMDCFPPDGWEIIGEAFDEPCPEGYEDIGSPGYSCESFKNQFCCTEGHSGAQGNCRDMVIHKRKKQCAFVSDIYAVEVPRGWRSQPKDLQDYEWTCPLEYNWVDEIEERPLPEQTAEDYRGRGRDIPCCSSVFLLLPAALVVVIGKYKVLS
jgi:hypothetical protein